MKTLEIYNFGPIREAKLDFTRVNVFIGQQSIGKSCILKIACHCAWVEKRLIVSRDVASFKKDNYFFNQLLEFHKLQGYATSADLRIVYNTSFLKLEYEHSTKTFSCKFKNQAKIYKRAKLSYIPAERNVIATIPNWMELSYKDTNTRSFLSDWVEARKHYAKDKLPILTLGAEYYYDEKNDVDMVRFGNMQNSLPLANASSGLQSLIPFMLYVRYLVKNVFQDSKVSIAQGRDNVILMERLYADFIKKYKDMEQVTKVYDLKLNNTFLSFHTEDDKTSFVDRYNNYTSYQHSDIFLEEPEENLFPETQAEVVYHLLEEIFSSEKEHSLFITTHSPYILYALNNAIFANIVRKDMPKEDFKELKCGHAVFKPSDVSIWQIKDGQIDSIPNGRQNTIQDKSGLVRSNYFDSIMKNVMADFNNMLCYRNI